MTLRFLAYVLLGTTGCGWTGGEPKEEPHEAPMRGPRRVELSAARIADLEIQPAAPSTLGITLGTTARLALDPRSEARVGSTVEGRIERVLVKPGDVVAAGDALLSVASAEVGQAWGAFRGAKARRDAASARLERLRALEADGVTSHGQVLDAEAEFASADGDYDGAAAQIRMLGSVKGSAFELRSPVAGQVLSVDAVAGQPVSSGESLVHIGNLGELWLLVDVYERDVARVHVGDLVQFTVDSYPDEPFSGTVDYVGAAVAPETRTIDVRVVVPNTDGRLKPGMFGTASLALGARDETPGIVLPDDAVVSLEGDSVVFVDVGDGVFEARPVEIGARAGTDVRLASGVTAGERVVVGGAFTLKSELSKGELEEDE